METLSTHRESLGSLASKIIMPMKLAYGPVHHGYIKITFKGMDVEVLVEITEKGF